ncbi:MAG: hypothetical protein J6Y04_03280 [Bacteroidaceae bacterium]|nr:hypothetical protein [Bacteroidaceae bacterium]
MKRAHSITKGRPFPSYFSSIELDLECGLLITAEPQTDAPKVETEPADDSLLMENQQLKADVKQLEEENTKLKIEKRKLKERLNGIEDYLNPSIDDTQGLTLKQKIVFFTSVTGVTLDKDYTHLSNFASFIALMCNEKNTSIGPMLSRIAKKDDNPQLQQTLHLAAQSVCDMLANTLTDATKNDKHQMINKIRENLRLDYPSPEDE